MSGSKDEYLRQPKQSIGGHLEPLSGCLIRQFVRCGKPNCRCVSGQPHGPYFYYFFRDAYGRAHKEYVPPGRLEEVTAGIERWRQSLQPFSVVRAKIKAAAKLLTIIESGQGTPQQLDECLRLVRELD